MARARTPHSSSRPSMLTALRIDARATDIHSSAMTIHTYASPSAKPREGDDGGDDAATIERLHAFATAVGRYHASLHSTGKAREKTDTMTRGKFKHSIYAPNF